MSDQQERDNAAPPPISSAEQDRPDRHGAGGEAEAGYGPPIDFAQAERVGTWPYGEVASATAVDPAAFEKPPTTNATDRATSRIIQARIAAVWTMIFGESVSAGAREDVGEAIEQVTREVLRSMVTATLNGRAQALTTALAAPNHGGRSEVGVARLRGQLDELHATHDMLAASGLADPR